MSDESAGKDRLTAKAALAGYTYPYAGEDQKAIDTVENEIHARFPESFAKGVADSISPKHAGIDEKEAKEQERKAQDQAFKERLEHPEDVKKEEKESPPGNLVQGAPVTPSITVPKVPEAKATAPKGASGETAKPKHAGGTHAAPTSTSKVPEAPAPIVLVAAGALDFDRYLDNYPSKSQETTKTLSKISEMGKVAKGFDKQVEAVVPKDGEGGTFFKNLAGKHELAAFSENPYAKVQGGLGALMRGLSTTNSVISMVGNITGKLGLILTIVGAFAMIFPPLGTAIEAVARVLNIIGVICDGFGLLISGALTGLNGVVLARQIGNPGCTNEEKAATADLMVSEATAASGHLMNIAAFYGPKFMKGFKNASKGVVGGLFARVKGSLAKFAARTLGPAGNWAKNVVYKMGIGVGDGQLGKLAKAAWNAPRTTLEAMRDSGAAKWVSDLKGVKAIGRFGAAVNRMVDNNKLLRGIDGTAAEVVGAKLASAGEQRYASAAVGWARAGAADEKDAMRVIEQTAAKDAANKEAGRINKEIRKSRKQSMDRGWNGDVQGSKPSWASADRLEAEKAAKVQAAEERGLEAAKERTKEKEAEEKAAPAERQSEEDEKNKFENDPAGYEKKTKRLVDKNDRKQAELAENQAKLEAKVEDENLPGPKRNKAMADLEKVKARRAELRRESDERRMVGVKASGREQPENLWQAKEKAGEVWAALHGKDETAEKHEERAKEVEKDSGHTIHEDFEKKERREHLEAWDAESEHAGAGDDSGWVTPDLSPSGASEYVNSTLDGLDAETGFEGHGEDEQTDQDASEPPRGGEDAANQPSAERDGGQVASASPAQHRPASDAAPAENKEETGGDLPELAYWPNLVKQGGDFDDSAQQLYRMKQIAAAFHKQQVEAKNKAIEQWKAMMDAHEYAVAKQRYADDHHKSLRPGIEEQKGSMNAANVSADKLGNAANEQEKSKTHADGKATKAPDPGEKPGRLHPIKRIWWYVKRWASKAAAKVFGFIQEKIASTIMRMLCGVSMNGMKKYTLALHRRSQWSAMDVGAKAEETTRQANEKAGHTGQQAKTAADEALDDATECDQNMADATSFMKNIEASEKDLAEEQQRASQFLATLNAAVAAERERKKQEQLKQIAATTFNAPAQEPASTAAPAPNRSVAPKKKEMAEKKPKPVSAASVSKVQSAASYVAKQASIVTQQLITSKQSQAIQLGEKLEKAGKTSLMDTAKGMIADKVGTRIIDQMKATGSEITIATTALAQQTPTDSAALRTTADQVRSQAKQLDEASLEAFKHLNASFRSTYEAAVGSRSAA